MKGPCPFAFIWYKKAREQCGEKEKWRIRNTGVRQGMEHWMFPRLLAPIETIPTGAVFFTTLSREETHKIGVRWNIYSFDWKGHKSWSWPYYYTLGATSSSSIWQATHAVWSHREIAWSTMGGRTSCFQAVIRRLISSATSSAIISVLSQAQM